VRGIGYCLKLGDAGDKNSAEVSLRGGGEVAGPVESLERQAKLREGVSRSCRPWPAEDHRSVFPGGTGDAADSSALVRCSADSSSAIRRRR